MCDVGFWKLSLGFCVGWLIWGGVSVEVVSKKWVRVIDWIFFCLGFVLVWVVNCREVIEGMIVYIEELKGRIVMF